MWRFFKRAAVAGAVIAAVVVVPSTAAQAGFPLTLPDLDLGTHPAVPFQGLIPITNTAPYGVGIEVDSLTVTPDDPSDVLIVDASDCLGREIPVGASCSVGVTLIPSSVGLHSAHVVGSGLILIPFAPIPLDVSARAFATLVPLDLDIGTIALGDQQIGVSHAGSMTFTSAFPAGITIENATVTLGGANVSDITSFDFTDCLGTFGTGDSCTLSATATVGGEGPRVATFVITADINGIPATLRGTITANGVPAPATLSPAALAFGSARIRTSTSLSTTLLNSTGVTVVVQSLTVGGTDAADFTVTADSCTGASLAWHASCAVTVRFTPSNRGARNGTVRFDFDRADVTDISLGLTGSGLAPVGRFDVAGLDFGRVPNGEASTESYATLTNAGDVSMHVTTISIGGDDPTSFTLADDTCQGATLPVGRSCTVAVSFTPDSLGPKAAILQINDDTVAGSDALPLTGAGTSSADLVAGLRPSTTTPVKNSNLTYTLKARNTGPNTAVGSWAAVDLPDGTSFVSTGVACTTSDVGDSGMVWCKLGRLRSGTRVSISVVVSVTAAKGLTLVAEASTGASTFDPFLRNNSLSKAVLVS
jgi:uncharacterized repeat protein (TIGR01451 family)